MWIVTIHPHLNSEDCYNIIITLGFVQKNLPFRCGMAQCETLFLLDAVLKSVDKLFVLHADYNL